MQRGTIPVIGQKIACDNKQVWPLVKRKMKIPERECGFVPFGKNDCLGWRRLHYLITETFRSLVMRSIHGRKVKDGGNG